MTQPSLSDIRLDATPDPDGLGGVIVGGRRFRLPLVAVNALARAVPHAAPIAAFQNEAESFAIDQLTIENRLDRIELYGSLAITLDQEGEARLRQLEALVAAVRSGFEAQESLPARLPTPIPGKFENPDPQGRL